MGYKTPYLRWMNEHIGQVYDSVDGLKMLELGNQVIRPDKQIREPTGKLYFTNLGYEHTSVDLNGLDGALIKDLSKLEDFAEYKEYFDVITNAGTIEHVEPFEKQHTAFLNVHNSVHSVTPRINALERRHSINIIGEYNKNGAMWTKDEITYASI